MRSSCALTCTDVQHKKDFLCSSLFSYFPLYFPANALYARVLCADVHTCALSCVSCRLEPSSRLRKDVRRFSYEHRQPALPLRSCIKRGQA